VKREKIPVIHGNANAATYTLDCVHQIPPDPSTLSIKMKEKIIFRATIKTKAQ